LIFSLRVYKSLWEIRDRLFKLGILVESLIPLHCGMVIVSETIMEIGQKVKVYRLRDRVSPAIVSKLGKVGTIKDYKMTDGSGVGIVVQFDDNSTTWFFEDELKPVEN
jgi:hypothetical protein